MAEYLLIAAGVAFFFLLTGVALIVRRRDREQTETIRLLLKSTEKMDVATAALRQQTEREQQQRASEQAATVPAPWRFLSEIDDSVLQDHLATLPVQDAALILHQAETTLATRLLARMPRQRGSDIVLAMASSTQLPKSEYRRVEDAIDALIDRERRVFRFDQPERKAATLLGAMGRSDRTPLLEEIGRRSPLVAERIRGSMFLFDDFARLDAFSIQTILRTVDKNIMVRALIGAPERAARAFFSNVSERTARMLREDMDYVEADFDECEAARAMVIAIAKDLRSQNLIFFPEDMPQGLSNRKFG